MEEQKIYKKPLPTKKFETNFMRNMVLPVNFTFYKNKPPRKFCEGQFISRDYEKIGFKAAAKASFCAFASAKSFPNVVKYVLIFGSVPEGRTITSAPPSNL